MSQRHPQRFGERIGVLIEVQAQHRATQCPQGQPPAFGVKVDLVAEPKSKFFARILGVGGYDTSFYLLGWTPGTYESYNVFQYNIQCRDEKGNGGHNNIGGYCNPKVDQLDLAYSACGDERTRTWRLIGVLGLPAGEESVLVPVGVVGPVCPPVRP